jgi:tRNA(fMet)-specific endonuclease VapC
VSACYLLDTCVLSEPIARHPNAEVVARILDHQGEIASAAPVIHELRFGCCRLPASRKRALLEAYLDALAALPVHPYDERAACWHAKERARLEAAGSPASFVDGQIASIAKVNNLVLVTRNVGDFTRFSDLEIEDWFAPSMDR